MNETATMKLYVCVALAFTVLGACIAAADWAAINLLVTCIGRVH